MRGGSTDRPHNEAERDCRRRDRRERERVRGAAHPPAGGAFEFCSPRSAVRTGESAAERIKLYEAHRARDARRVETSLSNLCWRTATSLSGLPGLDRFKLLFYRFSEISQDPRKSRLGDFSLWMGFWRPGPNPGIASTKWSLAQGTRSHAFCGTVLSGKPLFRRFTAKKQGV